jgi:hypothetical protein
MYFKSASCFDMTVGHHQALQIVYRPIIKEHAYINIDLWKLKFQFYNVFTIFKFRYGFIKAVIKIQSGPPYPLIQYPLFQLSAVHRSPIKFDY